MLLSFSAAWLWHTCCVIMIIRYVHDEVLFKYNWCLLMLVWSLGWNRDQNFGGQLLSALKMVQLGAYTFSSVPSWNQQNWDSSTTSRNNRNCSHVIATSPTCYRVACFFVILVAGEGKGATLHRSACSSWGAIENIQKFCIQLRGLNTTKHTYGEDCNLFHQLVSSSIIISKHILLPYDPGGLALRLDEWGGIPVSRCLSSPWRQTEFQGREYVTTQLWAVTIWFATWARIWAEDHCCVGWVGVVV